MRTGTELQEKEAAEAAHDALAEPVSHTPGPWLVEDDGDGGQVHNNTCKIADTFDLRDARLIAAVPDMLTALRQIADISEGSGTVNSLPHLAKIARAAIAKAEDRDV